MLGWIF